jgi:malate dehydrogenase (oxaloacetate-decarboxylating)
MTPLTKEELLAQARQPAADALHWHPYYKGKVQTMLKCPVRTLNDFAVWYTPGVAAACRAIQANPAAVYEHTNKANSIAIVSDGTRVLGLGDIGPAAGMPVMEGKALLFKYLGGVDAVPLCLGTKDPAELVRTVSILAPSFGGINLEDIAQPKCFQVLERLRAELDIPVWHDDQQGTATVVIAGLTNALKVVGKSLANARIALIGVGAANVAVYRLLLACGAAPAAIIACDRRGTLHTGRQDLEQRQDEFREKWRICRESNGERVAGGVAEALHGADVCLAFSASGPGIIRPEWVHRMAAGAIVFACANPVPEIWPWEAKEAGAHIVATGRSDFPNQVNNSLAFPGIFRGALDVRAKTITDEMALAASHEISLTAEKAGLHPERIVPRLNEWEIHPRIAAATGLRAVAQNIAGRRLTRIELLAQASEIIRIARDSTHVLMRENLIRPLPDQPPRD